jgi:antitoxin ChpS
MHTTHLRKVGGSVMLAVPPAFLEQLHLQPGAAVGMAVDGGRLVIEARPRPKYVLEDLLAQCDPTAEPSAEDREWIEARPAGGELF